MTEQTFQAYLCGCATAFALVAAAFFARFYRHTRNRLFLAFAAALLLTALQWFILNIYPVSEETRPLVYCLRLLAYLLILLGIWENNRRPR
jgi:hypothetical protein